MLYTGKIKGHRLPFPELTDYKNTWASISALADTTRARPTDDILEEFIGEPFPDAAPSIKDVNHVAVYMGDYRVDEELFHWIGFLQQLAAIGELRPPTYGPSYIAPKYYGTPGWWVSVERADGFVIEMFCCRAFGNWVERPVEERANLMSHIALSISSETSVLPTLNMLTTARAEMELIAYVERDVLGHCYGHIRNNRTHRVIELVHVRTQSNPIQESTTHADSRN